MARLNNHIKDLQHRGSLSPCGVSGWTRTRRMARGFLDVHEIILKKLIADSYTLRYMTGVADCSRWLRIMSPQYGTIPVDYICGWIRHHRLRSATLRRQPMAAESAVAHITDLAQHKKINPRSIRHICVFSGYATGMREIRDAIYNFDSD